MTQISIFGLRDCRSHRMYHLRTGNFGGVVMPCLGPRGVTTKLARTTHLHVRKCTCERSVH